MEDTANSSPQCQNWPAVHRFAVHDDKSAAVRLAPWNTAYFSWRRENDASCFLHSESLLWCPPEVGSPGWASYHIVMHLTEILHFIRKVQLYVHPIFVNNALLSGTSPVLPALLSGTSPVLPALPGWTPVLTSWHPSRVHFFFFFVCVWHAGKEQCNARKKRAGMAFVCLITKGMDFLPSKLCIGHWLV